MAKTEHELERFGETFIVSLEAIERILKMYPANHPAVGQQCQKFIDNFRELRQVSGKAVLNFVGSELYVNGVPLKRLSLEYQEKISGLEKKGIGLVNIEADLTQETVVALQSVLAKSRDELRAAGGIAKALESAGITTVRAGRVAVGVQADSVSMLDADAADPEVTEAELDPEAAQLRYNEAFGRLLVAVQGASAVDPRVRMVRTLSSLIESRLLERRAVRELAAKLREHDKESYRHALGGAVVSMLMGGALGLSAQRLRLLGEAALLRDMGKVHLSRDVLLGRDGSDATRAGYQSHPVLGAKLLLADREIDPSAAIVALEHHADLNGKGFPAARPGRQLHAFSRIVAVASDYDRMTGGYPGMPFISIWEAVGHILRGVGSKYSAAAVRAFLRVMGCVPEGTPIRLLDGREGIVAGTGRKTWLCPEVAILRDAHGNEVPPHVVATDGITQPGESVVHSFLLVSDYDRNRLEALRDID